MLLGIYPCLVVAGEVLFCYCTQMLSSPPVAEASWFTTTLPTMHIAVVRLTRAMTLVIVNMVAHLTACHNMEAVLVEMFVLMINY